MPDATMSAISTCGAQGVLPPVRTTIFIPAAESVFRLCARDDDAIVEREGQVAGRLKETDRRLNLGKWLAGSP